MSRQLTADVHRKQNTFFQVSFCEHVFGITKGKTTLNQKQKKKKKKKKNRQASAKKLFKFVSVKVRSEPRTSKQNRIKNSVCVFFQKKNFNAHYNINVHFIVNYISFILVQEREFYDDSNQSYSFLNILHLKYHVARINREATSTAEKNN